MKRLVLFTVLAVALAISSTSYAGTSLWGVDPTAEKPIINFDPVTGNVIKAYAAPGGITSYSTFGLAGWTNELFYVNNSNSSGGVSVIDPATGSVSNSFNLAGGWGVSGLGYWSPGGAGYLYTSGCSVGDVHRYSAVNGASPTYYWADGLTLPKSVAGDNGGRLFTYAQLNSVWGIYEISPTAQNTISLFSSWTDDDVMGMAFDGTYLYINDGEKNLYWFNNAGVLVNTTKLNNMFYDIASTEGVPVGTPEPLSLLLVGAGLLGLGIVRKAM